MKEPGSNAGLKRSQPCLRCGHVDDGKGAFRRGPPAASRSGRRADGSAAGGRHRAARSRRGRSLAAGNQAPAGRVGTGRSRGGSRRAGDGGSAEDRRPVAIRPREAHRIPSGSPPGSNAGGGTVCVSANRAGPAILPAHRRTDRGDRPGTRDVSRVSATPGAAPFQAAVPVGRGLCRAAGGNLGAGGDALQTSRRVLAAPAGVGGNPRWSRISIAATGVNRDIDVHPSEPSALGSTRSILKA